MHRRRKRPARTAARSWNSSEAWVKLCDSRPDVNKLTEKGIVDKWRKHYCKPTADPSPRVVFYQIYRRSISDLEAKVNAATRLQLLGSRDLLNAR